jgi:hypothetical protein
MIETYKILKNKYDKLVAPSLEFNSLSYTRGNDYKLKVLGANHDLRKHSFCVRVPKTWNNLNNTVVNSKTVNAFKNNLDKYWADQEILYNYEAPLS